MLNLLPVRCCHTWPPCGVPRLTLRLSVPICATLLRSFTSSDHRHKRLTTNYSSQFLQCQCRNIPVLVRSAGLHVERLVAPFPTGIYATMLNSTRLWRPPCPRARMRRF